MRLTQTEPDENFDLLRYASDDGKWEMGMRSMTFGVNVCGNRVGSSAYIFDYCAGMDKNFTYSLLLTMKSILQFLPESTTERELQRMLPNWQTRPIDRDPCWGKLQKLALDLAKQEVKSNVK